MISQHLLDFGKQCHIIKHLNIILKNNLETGKDVSARSCIFCQVLQHFSVSMILDIVTLAIMKTK